MYAICAGQGLENAARSHHGEKPKPKIDGLSEMNPGYFARRQCIKERLRRAKNSCDTPARLPHRRPASRRAVFVASRPLYKEI
jgi:hypothetical protein